jgi:hypothetical protein
MLTYCYRLFNKHDSLELHFRVLGCHLFIQGIQSLRCYFFKQGPIILYIGPNQRFYCNQGLLREYIWDEKPNTLNEHEQDIICYLFWKYGVSIVTPVSSRPQNGPTHDTSDCFLTIGSSSS